MTVAGSGAAAPSSLQPHPATVFAPPQQHAMPWQPAGALGLRGAPELVLTGRRALVHTGSVIAMYHYIVL